MHLARKSKKIPINYFQDVNVTQRPLVTGILFNFAFDFWMHQNMIRLCHGDTNQYDCYFEGFCKKIVPFSDSEFLTVLCLFRGSLHALLHHLK